MLSALQGTLLVREAMASAAVVVWAAAVLPAVPPAAAALVFAAGLMPQQLPERCVAAAAAAAESAPLSAAVSTGPALASQLLHCFSSSSLLQQHLAASGSSLLAELQAIPAAAKVCAVRGLLTAMPVAALAGDMGLQQQQPQVCQQPQQVCHQPQQQQQHQEPGGGTLLMRCALPFALQAAAAAGDVHQVFFAMSVLLTTLQDTQHIWHTMAQQQAAGGGQSADGSSSSSSSSSSGSSNLLPPWLPADAAAAVMALLWRHLEDPAPQVVAKVQECFVALLAVIATQHSHTAQQQQQQQQQPQQQSQQGPGHEGLPAAAAGLPDPQQFLLSVARDVLLMPPLRKGRYAPLTALLPHVGAAALLRLQPGLVTATLQAMQSNAAASPAAAFFRTFLFQLRGELGSTPGAAAGTAAAAAAADSCTAGQQPGTSSSSSRSSGTELAFAAALVEQHVGAPLRPWCGPWLPQLLVALWGAGQRSCAYVANYALPIVLQAEPLLLRPLLDAILAAHSAAPARAGRGGSADVADESDARAAAGGRRNTTAALVVVLRTARQLQLLGDLDALLPQQQQQQQQQRQAGVQGGNSSTRQLTTQAAAVSPVDLLLEAVSSASAALRNETLELVCVNARCGARVHGPMPTQPCCWQGVTKVGMVVRRQTAAAFCPADDVQEHCPPW
jgi:hypothetical protein